MGEEPVGYDAERCRAPVARLSARSGRRPVEGSVQLMRVFLCVLMALETTPYGVVAPLLPGIVRNLSLDEFRAGLLTGALPLGMLPACVAPMLLRRTPSDIVVMLTGLAADVAGCVLFANGPGLQSLIAGRFLMGVGTGLCFLGATRFLVKSSHPGQEGVSFGLGWGMLSVGTALGPAVGAVAVTHGATLVHNVFAATFAACMAALATATLSAPVRRVAHAIQNAARAPVGLLRRAPFLVGLAPSVVPAITFGVFYTLVPLRLSQDKPRTLGQHDIRRCGGPRRGGRTIGWLRHGSPRPARGDQLRAGCERGTQPCSGDEDRADRRRCHHHRADRLDEPVPRRGLWGNGADSRHPDGRRRRNADVHLLGLWGVRDDGCGSRRASRRYEPSTPLPAPWRGGGDVRRGDRRRSAPFTSLRQPTGRGVDEPTNLPPVTPEAHRRGRPGRADGASNHRRPRRRTAAR